MAWYRTSFYATRRKIRAWMEAGSGYRVHQDTAPSSRLYRRRSEPSRMGISGRRPYELSRSGSDASRTDASAAHLRASRSCRNGAIGNNIVITEPRSVKTPGLIHNHNASDAAQYNTAHASRPLLTSGTTGSP